MARPQRARRTVLGGTFDRLHAGHWALLRTAMRRGDDVAIGLTSDRYIATHPKPARERIQPYAQRRRALARWLRREYPRRRWRIVPLENGYGRSIEPGFDRLVVSAETVEGARRVNAERRRRHLPPLRVEIVPLVLADDLLPVSSHRIRQKVIDRYGRRRSPIRIALAIDPILAAAPWRRELRRVFPRARFEVRSPREVLREPCAELGLVIREPGERTAGSLRIVAPRLRLAPRRLTPGERPSQQVASVWPPRRTRRGTRSRNA